MNPKARENGEAPAVSTGALINSVQAVPDGLRATVGSSLRYAAALEFGIYFSRLRDRATVRIEPRPAFGPAADRARETFPRRVDEAVKEVL